MVTLDTASKQRACATRKSKPVQFTGWLAEPSIGSGKENAKVKVTTYVASKKSCCDTVSSWDGRNEQSPNFFASKVKLPFLCNPFVFGMMANYWLMPTIPHCGIFRTWQWPLGTVWMGRPQIPGCQRPQASVFRHRLLSFICIPGSNSKSEFVCPTLFLTAVVLKECHRNKAQGYQNKMKGLSKTTKWQLLVMPSHQLVGQELA